MQYVSGASLNPDAGSFRPAICRALAMTGVPSRKGWGSRYCFVSGVYKVRQREGLTCYTRYAYAQSINFQETGRIIQGKRTTVGLLQF
jgi:hypothetical protein